MVIILLIVIFILHLIDYWQTVYATQIFGLGIEVNPIARFLLEHDCGWIAKLIVLPILLALFGILVRIDKKQIWAIYVLLVVSLYVVIHNFGVLWELGLL